MVLSAGQLGSAQSIWELHCSGACGQAGALDRSQCWLHVYDVCLHSTSEGLPEVARFHTGDAEPELEWSPAGQLCIAQSSWPSADLGLRCNLDLPVQASSSAKSSALIWDPELAAVVHHLGPEVSAVLHKPEPCYQTEGAMWATSCRYLLAQGSPHPLNQDFDEDYDPFVGEVSGWLGIADVVRARWWQSPG